MVAGCEPLSGSAPQDVRVDFRGLPRRTQRSSIFQPTIYLIGAGFGAEKDVARDMAQRLAARSTVRENKNT